MWLPLGLTLRTACLLGVRLEAAMVRLFRRIIRQRLMSRGERGMSSWGAYRVSGRLSPSTLAHPPTSRLGQSPRHASNCQSSLRARHAPRIGALRPMRVWGRPRLATARTRGPTGPTAPPPRGQGPNAARQERAAPSQAPRTPFQGATTMGDLAARKGRALAESACKEVVIDGREEAALSVQAIKLCAAGYLMGSEHYVEKGKHVASKVYDATEKYANAAFRRTSPGAGSHQAQVLGQMPLEAPELMQTCAHLGQPEEGAYGICRARVTVNGLPVTACIDSGASSSMIPLHTVKRANLLHRVSKDSQHTFFTADGHEAKGHGVISGLGVHIGGDTLMKVDATVSKAGNYDLLLGNDFLGPLKATLDFSRGRLYFQKDETTTGFVETSVPPPHRGRHGDEVGVKGGGLHVPPRDRRSDARRCRRPRLAHAG